MIIDCGCLGDDEEGQLKKFLSEKHLKPVALLDTHLHIDHIFGNNFVKKAFGLEAQAGAADNYLIEHAVEYAAMLGITGITPPPPVGKYLNDGDVVKFGDSELKVIAVPGHSPGSLCFYSEPDRSAEGFGLGLSQVMQIARYYCKLPLVHLGSRKMKQEAKQTL